MTKTKSRASSRRLWIYLKKNNPEKLTPNIPPY